MKRSRWEWPDRQALWKTLQEQGILSEQGDLRPGIEVYDPKFQLNLPKEFAEVSDAVIDLLRSHRIERHVQNDKEIKGNPRRQEQIDSPEFKELWSRYRLVLAIALNSRRDELVRKAVDALKRCQRFVRSKCALQPPQRRCRRPGSQQRRSLRAIKNSATRGLYQTCLRISRPRPT